MDAQSIRTQISGRYAPSNPDLFGFKQRVKAAGIEVDYPVGDTIVEYANDFAITVAAERDVPFHLTELDFLQKISDNDVQITYNLIPGVPGYVGESTSVETVYAMDFRKPVVLLRPIRTFSATAPPAMAEIMLRCQSQLPVCALDQMEPREIHVEVRRLISTHRPINLTSLERGQLFASVALLTAKYKDDWGAFKGAAG